MARRRAGVGPMGAQQTGSTGHWIDGLRAGDSVAAQELWNEYFARLVAVAQARLKGLSRDVTGEDVALSALKSVMLGVRANRFPELSDSTSLWPLLVTITARKSVDEVRRQRAQKRAAHATAGPEQLAAVVGAEPSPEFAVEVADEMERLMARFDDPTLRTIALRRLEGFSNAEIARELSLSVRTVIRKLNRIRQEWEEAPMNDGTD